MFVSVWDLVMPAWNLRYRSWPGGTLSLAVHRLKVRNVLPPLSFCRARLGIGSISVSNLRDFSVLLSRISGVAHSILCVRVGGANCFVLACRF